MAPVIRGNSIYAVVNSNTWTGAKNAAKQLGGDLVTINNREEDFFVQSIFGPSAPLSGGANWGYWMGLYRDSSSSGYSWSDWKWISGQATTYQNDYFKPGETGYEPNGGYSDSPYGMVWGDQHYPGGIPAWNDIQNDGNAGQSPQIGITEIPLTSSITFSTAPKEGAGVFTTSINLSAGTSDSGNLAEGATVYWKVSGITTDDLATGQLSGSGTITNGKLDLQHSLKTDADTDEKFEVSVFSDAEMTQQIGITKSNNIQEAYIGNSSKSISLEKVWTKLLGTPAEEGAWTITADKNNAIYIAGTSLGNLDGLTNNGWYDGFLTKYTSDGSKQWTKLVGTSRQEGIYSVAASDDEFLYLAGHTGSDALVAKYSFDGTEQWRKSLGSGSWDAAWSIALGPSGDIYVAGNTEGSFDGQVNKGADDGFLTKYDASGNKVWTRFIGTPHADHYADNLVTTSDGSIYIGGTTRGNLDGQVNSGGSDAYLSKFNSDGTRQWTRLIGTTEDDTGSIVKPLSDGSLVVIGSTKGDLGSHANNGNYDIFANKYSSDGTQVWSKLIGGSGNDFASDLVSVGSNTYVTGFTDGSIDGIAENQGGRDAFVLVFNSEWDLICTNQFGTSGDDGASEITSSSDSTIYVVGNTGGNLHDQENQGNQDAFLIKFKTVNTSLGTDTTPPTLQSTAATNNQLILTFSEDLQVAGGGALDTSLLTVTVDGQQRRITRAQINPDNAAEVLVTVSGRSLSFASSLDVAYKTSTAPENKGALVSSGGTAVEAIAPLAIDTYATSINIFSSGISENYKNLLLTGSAVTGYGNSKDNTLTGTDANNTLDGLGGADTMIGGKGNDTYVVDNAADVVTELADEGTDTVQSSISYTLGEHLENLTLIGKGNIDGNGNSTNNKITGNDGANILNGNGGTDVLVGGRGNDTYVIDSVDDAINENGWSFDVDSVISSISWSLGINLENLTLTGSDAINGTGNNKDNIIVGNDAANILDGGNGGKDILTGQGGADTFTFGSRPRGFRNYQADHITDFSSTEGDKIQITKSVFGITSSTISFEIANGTAEVNRMLSTSSLFVYDASNGELHWNQNGTRRGAGTGGVLAVFDNRATLSAGDFTLI